MLFVPSVPEMYPEPTVTTVHVAGLTEGLCGAARPTHFDGVTTVVAKLFSIVGPCTAYFGRKDFQQLAVVRRMAADLDLPVHVVGCPLVREPDGVAMSSRNAYLSADERRRATGIFASLRAAAEAVEGGERDPEPVRAAVEAEAARHGLDLEYAEVRRASDLAPIAAVDGEVVVAVGEHGRQGTPDRQRHDADRRRRGLDRPRRHHNRRTGEHELMRRTMMKSKVHRATVTGADLDYVGSITLDPKLMELADVLEHEQVHVLDLDNGARFETYAISGGPGDVILNGAAARLVHTGDRVIVISYAQYDEAELESYDPKVVHVDSRNRPTDREFQELDRELHELAP